MEAYEGTYFVPKAVPNSKYLFLKNSSILTQSLVKIILYILRSNTSLRAPASWGMLGYNPATSTVTSNASLGISLRSLV